MNKYLVSYEIGEKNNAEKFWGFAKAEDADMAVHKVIDTKDQDGDPLSSIIMLRVTKVERI